jgi:hypothetical protein
MRRRRWAAVVAVFIIAILPLSFLGLKVASHHPAVRRAVLSRILPEVEGQMSIGELEIGFASLSLGDVLVDLGDRGSVHVPSATVSLRYPRLLARGFEARRALGTVIVSGPRIVVRRGLSDTASADAPGALDLRSLGQFLPDYMGISDATVIIEEAGSAGRAEITSLDLFLERRDAATVSGDAVGDMFGGSDNLTASFSWDVRRGALSADLEIVGADLALGSLLPANSPVDPVSGSANIVGSGTFVAGAGFLGVNVAFELEDADVALPGGLPAATGLCATGTFDGVSLSFSVPEAEWESSAFSARGVFDFPSSSFRPLDLDARHVPGAALRRFLDEPAADVSGSFDVVARATGKMDSASVDVSVRADLAEVGGIRFEALALQAALSDSLLDVGELRAACLGGDLRASGTLRRTPADSSWAFYLEADAEGLSASDVAAVFGRSGWSGDVTLTGFQARGSTGRLDVESLVAWTDLRAGAVAMGSGAGGFLLQDGSLAATFSSRDGSLVLSGEAKDVFGEAVVDAELTLSELPLHMFSGSDAGGASRLSVTGAVAARGPVDALDLSGSLFADGDDATAAVAVDGTLLRSPVGRDLRLDLDAPGAVVRGVSAPFTATLVGDQERLSVRRLEVTGVGEATAEIGLRTPHDLRGSIVVSEASLPDLFSLVFGGVLPESIEGLVFASISLGGTLERPEAQGQVQVGNGRAFGVTGLDAAVSATIREGVVGVREAVLRDHGTPVLSVTGDAEIGGGLALSVEGQGVPGPLLGGDASSRFDLTLGIGGSGSDPTLDGRVAAVDGAFLGVAFDDFSARVTGAERLVRIDPLRLEKRGSYTMSVVGAVPFEALTGTGGEREGALSIEVDGDPLSFLAEIVPFATQVHGSGRMRANLVGTRGDVTVASAQLTADASGVRPTALFERVEDLRVDISIVDGTVERGRVEGSVDGSAVSVESLRGVEVEGRAFEPLVLGGIDAGVLAVSSEPRGARAVVPRLMMPGDVGRVAVLGKGGAPSFLIGGPAERPLLWGELEFSDVSFTYPLLESGKGLAGGLFSRAEWSIRMTAGRNLWYQRPDVNLQLVRGGSLDFLGVPREGTLCVSGRVGSKRGNVTYANTDFDVREVTVDFPLFCEPPRFFVEAETRVEDGTTITLTMESFEGSFGSVTQATTLDESALRLTSDSPDDNTQEEILARLQYGVGYALLETEEQAALDRRRAVEVIGSQLSGRIVRPLLSPVEGRLKRSLRLDLVRFDIDFVEHFLGQLDLWQAQEASAEYQPFLADSRITLGKYISRDWLLSYVGFAEAYEEELGDRRLGLRHELGVEYEVSRNTSISMRVVYDPSLAGWDRRISIENRYDF